MRTVIGPAGIPLSCNGNNVEGLRETIRLGLGAYEVEFVRGVRMNNEMAAEMNLIKNNNDLKISCHAPYYINCNNPSKYLVTERHLLDCIRISQVIGFSHIVFHTGFLMESKRAVALKNSIATIKKVIRRARIKGYKDFVLGPEVAGKKYQVGTINELISICKECKECRPVIDWAHLHAITNGGLKTKQDFIKPLELISDELGPEYLKGLHCHFSEILFNDKGEVKHLPLGSCWKPDFRLLAEVIKDHDFEFSIICETPLIEHDALRMQEILNNK
jgi:deoxyribonuclease-4